MNTRKFKLVLTRTEGIYVNTKTIDLNNFNSSAFASNPSGLGAKASYGLLKVGSRNINGNRNQELLPITLEIAFKDYDKMNSFLEKVAWGDYKGILEYQDFFIRIQTHIGIVNINGYQLSLEEMTVDDLVVKGKIESIDFESIVDQG